MTLSENLMDCVKDWDITAQSLFGMLWTNFIMTITTTPLILIKQDKTYFKQRSNTNMEQIIEFYLKELKNNQDLTTEVIEQYHEIIDTYAHVMLSAMINWDKNHRNLDLVCQ